MFHDATESRSRHSSTITQSGVTVIAYSILILWGIARSRFRQSTILFVTKNINITDGKILASEGPVELEGRQAHGKL
jgi:hypothetical protein